MSTQLNTQQVSQLHLLAHSFSQLNLRALQAEVINKNTFDALNLDIESARSTLLNAEQQPAEGKVAA